MSLLAGQGLSKSYGSHQVLNNVTVSISEGERIGLVGNNGSGKSTLAIILAGLEEPDLGEIMARRGLKVGALTQEPSFPPGYTALQCVLEGLDDWHRTKQQYDEVSRALQGTEDLGPLLERQTELTQQLERLGGWDVSHQANALCEQLGVRHPDRPIDVQSGGEKRRVALARLLLSKPELMVLDEPTNHLDTQAIEWLERYLVDEYKGALLLVTHDRYFLDRVATKTWELHSGAVESYEGGWESYLVAKAEREAIAERTEANRQNFLRKEVEWLRRQPKARGTKQKARIERAHEALGQKGPDAARNLTFQSSTERQGSTVVKLDQLSLVAGQTPLVSDLSFILGQGQRLGILGPNGCGKTTLLRSITGSEPPASGTVERGQTVKIAYFDQTRSSLDPEQSVAYNVAEDRQRLDWAGTSVTIYSYLERFLFSRDELRKKVGMLSGGERARVALAKLLLQPSNLLILDEPTNDLDVSTLGALEEMLCSFAGSVIVVTHDRYFLNRVATDLLVFEGQQVVTHYVGNYDTYLSVRPPPGRGVKAPESQEAPSKKAAVRREPAKKLSYKEGRELEGMMDAIAGVEQRVASLQEQLASPELYREPGPEVVRLQSELQDQQLELERLMARWEELEEKRGA